MGCRAGFPFHRVIRDSLIFTVLTISSVHRAIDDVARNGERVRIWFRSGCPSLDALEELEDEEEDEDHDDDNDEAEGDRL